MEFESKEQMQECREILLDKYGFTGEMSLRRDDDGTWRLSAHAEKRFRDSTFEKLPGKRQDE